MSKVKQETTLAWSCTACGHIRGPMEPEDRCAHCGQHPAHWNSAEVSAAPVDAVEPAVGHGVGDAPQQQTGYPEELFPLSPPGTEGVDVNPELRVRY